MNRFSATCRRDTASPRSDRAPEPAVFTRWNPLQHEYAAPTTALIVLAAALAALKMLPGNVAPVGVVASAIAAPVVAPLEVSREVTTVKPPPRSLVTTP